jgi:hypothetical protein
LGSNRIAAGSGPDSTLRSELAATFSFYAAVAGELDPETGLGGKLLYAGELDGDGRRLVRAANIAGAASLSSTAEVDLQKQAIREGVVDFLVTTLDEALRILKNEIRKRQPVAVCVAAPPRTLVIEMLERGVVPDLLAPATAGLAVTVPEAGGFLAQGAHRIEARSLGADGTFMVVQIPTEWRSRVAEFDALLLDFVPPEDYAARRWLRLSPRYLPSEARRWRSFWCAKDVAARLMDRIGIESGPPPSSQ